MELASETTVRVWASAIGLLLLAVLIGGFLWLVQNDFQLSDPFAVNTTDPEPRPGANGPRVVEAGATATKPPRRQPDKPEGLPYPDKPKDHWSNNPKYAVFPPQLDKPEEREDAVIRMKEETVSVINTRDGNEVSYMMSEWMNPANGLTPDLRDMALHEENRELRAFASRVLILMKRPTNRDIFLKMLTDDYWAVRSNALDGLDSLNDPDIIQYAEAALYDNSGPVRAKAEELLKKYKGD